jgi:DNA-directed RNA polymerase subunit A"
MTLNTFHFAGVAEMNITLGLPRIIEILDGRKNIGTPMMEIYLKKPYSTGKNIKELALSIKETKLEEISTEFLINLVESTITITLDKIKMKEFDITTSQVTKAVSKQLKGFSVKASKDDNSIILKSRSKEESLNDVYKAKERVKEFHIKGIKNISQVLPVKRGEEFIIITSGSNLSEILQLDEVDSFRTTTNDIFEIEEVFGIEAARQAIVEEVFKVIENQGLNVDVRHIMLVADTMCVSGFIKGITRYGVVSEKSSVLARASFETPIKHIINAALIGEVDNLNSVVENVMLNQPVPVGTGLPGLVTKIKKKGEK